MKLNTSYTKKLLDHKVLDAVLVAVLLLIIGGIIFFYSSSGSLENREPPNNKFESPEQYVQYNLTSQGVFPYDHTIDPSKENIYLENQRDETLIISFDQDNMDNIELEPGDKEEIEAERITYFEANNSKQRIGRGKINIQQ